MKNEAVFMTKLNKWTILPLLTAFVLAGCSDGDQVASVDGRDISESEFLAYLELKRIPADNTRQVERALEDYLRREALSEAIAQTDALDQQAIEAEVNEFRKQLVISRYFQQHLKDKVDDAAIANYYAQNADDYRAERAHLAHILIRVDEDMSEEERQVAHTTITEARSRIARGEDFAEVAREMSEDQSSANDGGDLGWMKKGAVDAAFSRTAFALEPGEVSEIVTTPFGFHVIKLIDGPETVSQPLEAVRGDIRHQLRQQARDAESRQLLESINVDRNEDWP